MAASNTRKFLLGALGGGLGGAAIGVFAKHGGGAAEPLRDLVAWFSGFGTFDLWDLAALPLLWLVAVAVHEAGHLFGGMARGMRFLMFVVFPVGVVRADGRVQLRTYFNLGSLAGFAVSLPDERRPLRPQMMTMIVGGPLASLGLAVAAGIAAAALDGRAASWALLVAAISTLLFFVSAIPSRLGGFLSDGLQALQMRRDPGFLRRRAHLIALMGLGVAGARPRSLDAELLERARAETGTETMYDIATWLYSFHHAVDGGDIDGGDAWLARIEPVIAQYPDGFRQALAIELALFEALHRRRLDVAERWLGEAKGGVVDASRRALAHAAVAAARGERDASTRHLADAERTLARALDPGLSHLSRDQIATLRASLAAA